MHPKIIAKKVIDFNKANFDNTFEAITVLQDHSEKMVGFFLEKATLFPEDGKKIIKEWLESYKQGRKDFKETVDNSFKSVENFFENSAYTMDFSAYGFKEKMADSLNDVTGAIKKTSEDVQGKSIQEISKEMNIAENTVYVNCSRVKERIRKKIREIEKTLG